MIKRKFTDGLFDFIETSTCSFTCIETIKNRLLNEGFHELYENELWNINNGKYKSKEFDCVAEYIENPKEFVNHKSEMNKYFDSFSFDDIDVNPLFIERYKKF